MSLLNLFKKVVSEVSTDTIKNVTTALKTEKVGLSLLPEDVNEMKQMPEFNLADPVKVVALTIASLVVYTKNKDKGIEMLNLLKGPEPLAIRDLQFLSDRLTGKTYIPLSYFDGATDENDYAPNKPYTIKIIEQSNSREENDYIKLFVTSGGADNERPIKLRLKKSTNEWFLYEFSSLISNIRIPKSTDKWA